MNKEDLSAPSSSSPSGSDQAEPNTCPEPVFPYVGFGQYCLNCHASAANGQSTFATPRHVLGLDSSQSGPVVGPGDSIHQMLARPLFLSPASLPSPCMVPESEDHVVAAAKSAPSRHFVTSDQCTGCHNATGTLSPTQTDLP